ncbi:2706_t:CDS:10, partial [Funneliformis mosseae]
CFHIHAPLFVAWGSLSPSGGSTRRMDYLIRQKGCWDTNAPGFTCKSSVFNIRVGEEVSGRSLFLGEYWSVSRRSTLLPDRSTRKGQLELYVKDCLELSCMGKIVNFTLDPNFCQPNSRISQFFSKTLLMRWNCVDLFTKFVYNEKPNVTPQEVLDIYNQSLIDITTIKNINCDVVHHVRKIHEQNQAKWLKTIGDSLLDIRRLQAKKRKSDVYADWYSEVDKESSSKNRHQNDELDSSSENTPTTCDESDGDVIVLKRKKDDDANEKEDIVPANEDADKSKLYEELANDVVKQYITSERLEDIWRTVMKRLEDKRIRVQSIESRIIDLTNWTNLEWSRILKHEDKIALMKSFNKKLEKERIDQKVLDFIDNPSNSLRNLNDLQEWKTKISTIGSEDAILASEIISFFHKCCRREINILTVPLRERDYTLAILGPLLGDLLQEFNIGQFELFWIEKICNATNSRKRKSLNAEYIELNRDTTKLDMSLEFRNFNIEIMTVEVGNTEKKKDELKLQSDHTAIKIELKDMIDDFYNKLHFNKKDLADIYTIGIQVTGHHWSIYSLSYDHDLNFYFFTELATLDVPKTPSTMRGLLPTFIKTLLGLRHTLLALNDKILSITSARRERKSTPSPPSSPPHETSETPK